MDLYFVWDFRERELEGSVESLDQVLSQYEDVNQGSYILHAFHSLFPRKHCTQGQFYPHFICSPFALLIS